MRRLALALLLIQFFGQCVVAQEMAVTFEGELFTKKYEGSLPNGGKLLEFVRESESFESWTKLIGYRYQQLPALGNDPGKMAVGMEQILKAANPKAQSRIIVNEKSDEALIDFLTWPPDGRFMEFNVFRIVKSTDGNAIVLLQLAYRFTDASVGGPEKFRKIREEWINYAIAFDIKVVHAAFAQ